MSRSDAAGITANPSPARSEVHPARLGLLLGTIYGPVTFGIIAAAVAVPYIPEAAGPVSTVWLLSGYAIALGVGTAVFGPLTERWGTLACLRLGSVLMLAGTAACLLSATPGAAVAGRVVLALGSSAVVTVVLTIAAHVDAAHRRPLATALGAVMTVFLSMATLAGGFAAVVLGWRAAVVLPVLSVLVVPWVSRRHHRDGRPSNAFDGVGAALLAVLAACTVGLTQITLLRPTTAVALLGGAVASGIALWVRARHRSDAFVPATLVREVQFRRVCLLAGCIYAARFSVVLVAGHLLANDGWTPLSSGMLLVPCAVAGVVLAHYLDRRRMPSSRALLLAAGALVFVGVTPLAPAGPLVIMSTIASSVVFTLGQPMLTVALATLRTDRRGTAVGLAYFSGFAGGAGGTAVVATLIPAIGAGPSIAVVAVACLSGAALALTRGSRDPAADRPGDAAGITPELKEAVH
ncbi:Predicted arabinose efflux permease, MFS family [Micromonospora nigra]|uniref:Predicted arabinose efflux permease, MFS family n=1 Tax=Micromonospora nigra TaxID=145857 RepID=A0A1C6R7K7_9ACTN|nr:MFS transporter [Micromonospora nigra]SCL13012.1 Predicted arabinose efflux permease, MFS family [Micromonospora nigra]